ncbi:MAG TPA: agmatine deiminase family protein [Myxococcota bacterium]
MRSRVQVFRYPSIALAVVASLVATASAAPAADPPRHLRVAAEWEPALGALVAWPPVVPEALLVEIARDDRLFLLVDDAEVQAQAEARLAELGVDRASVEFVLAEKSANLAWTRDWGPFALFDEHREHHFADPRFINYPQSTPDCEGRLYNFRIPLLMDLSVDDGATEKVARTLGFSNVQLPFAFTGGNALVDGHGTAFSTCVMLNENRRRLGLSKQEFLRAVEERLGISNYVVLPNFEWFGIQHIDCLLKPLDEETILVKRVPEDHPDYGPIEEIVSILSSLTNPHGRPYRILRIDTPPYLLGHFVANYTNSLILNRKVFVPLFGIPADAKALETWREAMPGYEVIGYENPGYLGWAWYDALHCRVRAIWDPEMLYMHHRRLDQRVAPASSYDVEVILRDYSRKGLVDESLGLSWRLRGETRWNEVPLEKGAEPERYVASIRGPGAGKTVEYFLSAADRSGRRESLPRGAPVGFYSFSIELPAASTVH